MSAALQLTGVQCIRAGRPLFDPLNVSVSAGQLLRVTGPNGSGKTSLLRCICGLSQGWRGLMVIGDRIIGKSGPHGDDRDGLHGDDDVEPGRDRPVYLGHAFALGESATATENLMFWCALAGIAVDRHRALDALASVGLQTREQLPTSALSQGQRRRIGLARLALSRHQGLWVLDEPFNALDDAASGWLQQAIHGHAERGGVTVMASHQERLWERRPDEVRVALAAPPARRGPFAPMMELVR